MKKHVAFSLMVLLCVMPIVSVAQIRDPYSYFQNQETQELIQEQTQVLWGIRASLDNQSQRELYRSVPVCPRCVPGSLACHDPDGIQLPGWGSKYSARLLMLWKLPKDKLLEIEKDLPTLPCADNDCATRLRLHELEIQQIKIERGW